MGLDYRLLAVLALAACLLIAIAVKIVLSVSTNPEKRERRRRLKLSEGGRLHSGLLTDAADGLIHYKYELHGVVYECSQDISGLTALVPADASRIVGPVTLKYFVRNPGNSIVISEKWSGLRIRDAAPDKPIPQGEMSE